MTVKLPTSFILLQSLSAHNCIQESLRYKHIQQFHISITRVCNSNKEEHAKKPDLLLINNSSSNVHIKPDSFYVKYSHKLYTMKEQTNKISGQGITIPFMYIHREDSRLSVVWHGRRSKRRASCQTFWCLIRPTHTSLQLNTIQRL